jgi:dihydroorotase-like cyclic amidohydrolase
MVSGGLAVQDERILQIGSDASLPKAKQDIDARGLIIFPGLIDPHTHIGLGTPRDEATFKSDIRTESIAAAVGGVTTLISTFQMQFNPKTCIPEHNVVKQIAKENSIIDYKFTVFPLGDGLLDEIPKLVNEEGITSFKFPLLYAGPEGKYYGVPWFDLGYVYRGFEAIAKVGPPALAMIHAEEGAIIEVLKERLKAAGRTDLKAWSESRPGTCEAIHVLTSGLIAMEVGVPLYVVHTSAKESVDAIAYLKSKGVRVYGETCPHYIAPITKDADVGIIGKVNPPLRGLDDCERLWKGIYEGTIVTIGSDHGVHFKKDKEEKGIWDCRPGLAGIGAILPIMVSEGINKGRITFEDMAKLCAENTARLFGIYPKKGVLSPGSDADIVIIDPKREWTMGVANMKGGSDISVWEGRTVKGKAVKTFVRGRLVVEDGETVIEPPHGTFVHRV